MNGVVIVGSDPDFIKNKFGPKLKEHGIEVLDHWGWSEKTTRRLPDTTKAVVIMSSETGGHLVRAAKDAAKERSIPLAEVPRQMSKALPRLQMIGLVTDTSPVRADLQGPPDAEEVVYLLARHMFAEDSLVPEKDLLRKVRKLNPNISENEALGLVQSGVATYKSYFVPAVEWSELYLNDDVDLSDAAVIRLLQKDHTFNLYDNDFKDVVARARHKVFGNIMIPEYPDDAWSNYVSRGLLARKIVESKNILQATSESVLNHYVDYVTVTDSLWGEAPPPIEPVADIINKFASNPLGLSLFTIRALRSVNPKVQILQATLNSMYVRAFGKKLDTNMANAAAWYLDYTYRSRSDTPHLTRDEFLNEKAIHNILDSCADEDERALFIERFNNIRSYFGEPALRTSDQKETAQKDPEPVQKDPEPVGASDSDGIVVALRGMDPDVLLDVVAHITGTDLREKNAELAATVAETEAKLADKTSQFHSMRARVGALTQANNLLRKETESLTEEVAAVTKSRDDLLASANTKQDKVTDLQGRLERQARRIGDLQRELREAQHAVNEKGNAFVADLEANIKRLESERCTLRDLLDEAENTSPKTPSTTTGNEVTLRELIERGYSIKLTPNG